jgi:hypothetical protein
MRPRRTEESIPALSALAKEWEAARYSAGT